MLVGGRKLGLFPLFLLLDILRRGAPKYPFKEDGVVFGVLPSKHRGDVDNLHISQQLAGINYLVFVVEANQGFVEILLKQLRNVPVGVPRFFDDFVKG